MSQKTEQSCADDKRLTNIVRVKCSARDYSLSLSAQLLEMELNSLLQALQVITNVICIQIWNP